MGLNSATSWTEGCSEAERAMRTEAKLDDSYHQEKRFAGRATYIAVVWAAEAAAAGKQQTS